MIPKNFLDIEPEPEIITVPAVDLTRGPVLSPNEQETALAKRGEAMEDRARSLTILDAHTFMVAGMFLEQVDAVVKEINDFFEDDIKRAHATWKGLTSKRALYSHPLERARQIVATRYAEYERADKARAEAKRRADELELQQQEQERLRAEADMRETQARQFAEDAARASSRDEALALEARAAEAQAEARDLKVEAATVQAPVLPVVRETPDIGPKVRASWTFEVTDKLALIKAVAAGTVSAEAVEPNDTYLRKRAQADKSTCQIPGVRVWDAGSVVKRPARR